MRCFVHFDLRMGFAPHRCAIFRHLKFKKWSENVFCFVHFDSHMCFFEIGASKMARECGVLRIFTYKCASRHSGVPFFQIGTSKMAPSMWCFAHFDLQMCFAPQRRAIFQIGTSKMVPSMWCFVHFDFKMCFPPQRRAIFHFSPEHLRTRRFSEPTFRTSGTTNHWKNAAVRDFPNISRSWIFFLVTPLACWSSF